MRNAYNTNTLQIAIPSCLEGTSSVGDEDVLFEPMVADVLFMFWTFI